MKELELNHYFPKKFLYKKDSNILDGYVNGEFVYFEYEDLYNRKGEVAHRQVIDTVCKREIRRLFDLGNTYYKPIQINYNFYLMNYSRFDRIGDLELIGSSLQFSELGNFKVSTQSKDSDYLYEKDGYFNTYMKPKEVCLIGHSRYLLRSSYSSFLELDYNEYTKRKNDFIKILRDKKDSEDEIRMVQRIYAKNIKIASIYYNVDESKITHNEFNRSSKMIERLQKKITYKQKTK